MHQNSDQFSRILFKILKIFFVNNTYGQGDVQNIKLLIYFYSKKNTSKFLRTVRKNTVYTYFFLQLPNWHFRWRLLLFTFFLETKLKFSLTVCFYLVLGTDSLCNVLFHHSEIYPRWDNCYSWFPILRQHYIRYYWQLYYQILLIRTQLKNSNACHVLVL